MSKSAKSGVFVSTRKPVVAGIARVVLPAASKPVNTTLGKIRDAVRQSFKEPPEVRRD